MGVVPRTRNLAEQTFGWVFLRPILAQDRPRNYFFGVFENFETCFSKICAHSERYRNLLAGIFEILTFYGNIASPLSPIWMEVWRNDRYLRDRLIRVLARDTARTRFPIQTWDITMSDTKFEFRNPILRFRSEILARDLKRVFPGLQARTILFLFFFSRTVYIGQIVVRNSNQTALTPRLPKKNKMVLAWRVRLYVEVSPSEVPARKSQNCKGVFSTVQYF